MDLTLLLGLSFSDCIQCNPPLQSTGTTPNTIYDTLCCFSSKAGWVTACHRGQRITAVQSKFSRAPARQNHGRNLALHI
jgi:hypothetical protein